MPETKYGKTALIDDLTAATSGMTRGQIETVVNSALSTIAAKVASGRDVTLTGFGTFRRSERSARTGTNIRTGQKIQIPAQQSVRFTAGSELRSAVKGRGGGQGSYAKQRGR